MHQTAVAASTVAPTVAPTTETTTTTSTATTAAAAAITITTSRTSAQLTRVNEEKVLVETGEQLEIISGQRKREDSLAASKQPPESTTANNNNNLSSSLSSPQTATTATTKPTATATTTTTVSNTNSNSTSEMAQSTCAGNSCAGCRKPIKDRFIFSVIEQKFHQDCVRCSDCSLALIERCYTYDGKLYCRLDYLRRYGPKCSACQEPIKPTELVQRVKENLVYHLNCFVCQDCKRHLRAGEQLHLIDEKRLLCKRDFMNIAATTASSAATTATASTTSIRNHTTTTTTTTTTSNTSHRNHPQHQQQQQQQNAHNQHQQQSTVINNSSSGSSQVNQKQGNQENREHLSGAQPPTTNQSGRSVLANETLMSDEDEELDEEEEEDEDDEEGIDEVDQDECLDDLCSMQVGGYSRLQFDNDNNNLENEENTNSTLGFSNLGGQETGGNHHHPHSHNNHHHHNTHHHHHQLPPDGKLRYHQLTKKSGKQQQQQQHPQGQVQLNGQLNGPSGVTSGSKRKRRRKQKLAVAADGLTRPRGALISATGKKLASRNGESILNGASPILSCAHPVPTLTSIQQQQQSQLVQVGAGAHLNKSVSSSVSTASNSSTSSSMSLGPAHHSHHQLSRGNNNSGQQHSGGQVNQSGGGGGGNAGGGGHKPTRVRTVLNEKQLQTLRDCYAHNPRPDALMKEQLVDLTGLSSRVIRVWFQNKRCKDKKKSILYKQMQQHEKDGRHLAGLTLMRGVPMVASSPIQYDDHSTVSSGTPGAQSAAAAGSNVSASGAARDPANSVSSMLELAAGQREAATPPQHPGYPAGPQPVHSPNQLDIHAYQPPWKSLIEYAQQSSGAANSANAAAAADRLNANSPRYQQLMGQIHGYQQQTANETADQRTGNAVELRQQYNHPENYQQQDSQQLHSHNPHLAPLGQQQQVSMQQVQMQVQQQVPQPMTHLHQFPH